ncbi:hypothetical protein CFP65_7005 [Kitasatospora sp. MMS16-BH015]|uniref:3-oxoacyl-ACP synthase III family protein n=1 Tax=Kitasatospora sp. MMS16-BH015 TaxID=2018025 RepID=UPI000CA2EA73|nr:3-oxoacyl-[acyl-carrier-protein] synthase III C-terminal domain-containing protein [Kitasatospora sp. MMS16-BH015]AUG81614.1 hypothetical protein CFP65_7005 [Kitasatospora sp. MMS16-BH015]
MTKIHTRVRDVAVHVPTQRQTTAELDTMIRAAAGDTEVPDTLLERLYGLEERTVAPPDTYPSHLAAQAARDLLQRTGCAAHNVDLIIYAAVTGDVEEPATGHIVAAALGARCAVFDVKNACNAVISAMQIAEALIATGTYRRVLIATGEVLSRFTRRRIHDRADLLLGLATFTCGDMGAAMLLEASPQPGILGSRFACASEGWPAALVHNAYAGHHDAPAPEARVDSEALASAATVPIARTRALFADLALDPARDLALACVHQPSVAFLRTLCERFGIPVDRTISTFPHHGNVGAASLPLQLVRARDAGRLARGDRIALLGAASGLSLGLVILQW